MHLTKMRPSTTCLYSAAFMLARSLSAVAQSVFLISSSMQWRFFGSDLSCFNSWDYGGPKTMRMPVKKTSRQTAHTMGAA